MEKRLPEWFKQRIPRAGEMTKVTALLNELELNTVCQSAMCPNMYQCFTRNTATFMILGNVCTRNCTFCAVNKGLPNKPDVREPSHVADAVIRLGLKYAVITSVTRDDLPDGGASHFRNVIELIHEKSPGTGVEVLVPDFAGNTSAVQSVVAVNPEVLNHNIETIPRLYSAIRPMASYRQSLEVLNHAKQIKPAQITKSGIMLGLGESRDEVLEVMRDLRQSGCDLLTLGQYLAPSSSHHPVHIYIHPEEFSSYIEPALEMGFAAVASAPMVRSSYRAEELFLQAVKTANKRVS